MHLTPLGIRVPDNTDSTELWTHFDNMADDIDALIALRALATKSGGTRKAVNEPVTNSAAVQNDDDLKFTAEANSIYVVDVYMLVSVGSGSSVPDFKAGWSLPALANVSWSLIGPDPAMASASPQIAQMVQNGLIEQASGAATLACGVANTGFTPVQIKGTIVTGANAGVCNVQWAQNTATAAVATTVNKGSYIAWRKL